MNTLYMMIGLPGSGKSTFAKHLASSGAEILSSDQIREELGCIGDMSRNKEVFSILRERLSEKIKYSDIVLDCTNTRKEGRSNLLRDIEANKIGIYLNRDLEVCKRNNQQRDRVVPESVIHHMNDRLQPPELAEGFSAIVTYK